MEEGVGRRQIREWPTIEDGACTKVANARVHLRGRSRQLGAPFVPLAGMPRSRLRPSPLGIFRRRWLVPAGVSALHSQCSRGPAGEKKLEMG